MSTCDETGRENYFEFGYDPNEDFEPEDFFTDEDELFDDPEPAAAPATKPEKKLADDAEYKRFAPTDPDKIDDSLSEEDLALIATMVPVGSFVASDYAPYITGSGAAKLADSAVAPLVAWARGYFDITPANFEARMKEMNQRKNSGTYKKWDRVMNRAGEDGLAMPWFSATTVHNHSRGAGTPMVADEWQVRPSDPPKQEGHTAEKPKFEKYMFPTKARTPLDIHPATPHEWIDHTPLVMVTEGLLKGDSALTGWLLDRGINRAELSEPTDQPRDRLVELMERIHPEDRILFTTIAGVNNINQNPADWRNISFLGRTVRIAFDADLGKNINVWRAGSTLEQMLVKKQKVHRIEWLVPHMDGEDGEKAGVDDYLARHTWAELEEHVKDRMPEAPPVDQRWEPGEWRITDDGTAAEMYYVITDQATGAFTEGWKPTWKLGGRISSKESARRPTDTELRTGQIDHTTHAKHSESSKVQIELKWETEEGTQTAIVRASTRLLHYPPIEWEKKDADLPDDLLMHPAWPVHGSDGMKWLSAMKAHRVEDQTVKQRWDQMGWVPVEDGGIPAFIVGSRVIGDEEHLDSVHSAVDDSVVPMADKWGVGEYADIDWTNESDRELVRSDFAAVISHYIDSGAWTSPTVAAAVLATALRPALPLRPETTMFIYGPPGKGKSWTAKTQMYFWGADSTCWVDVLPGSAKDTAATLESRVSRVPIYVVDDMAPSQSASEAAREMAKLETLTRNIFNNASRGRMNASMEAQKTNTPIAQLIITAENPFNTPSVRQRLVPIHMGHGALHSDNKVTDQIDKLHRSHGVQGRFTASLISYIRFAATQEGGWDRYQDKLAGRQAKLRSTIGEMMADRGFELSGVQRVAKLTADMALTYWVLSQMASELRMDDDFIKKFSTKDGRLISLLVDHMAAAHAENKTVTPGVSLVKALRELLRVQGAHVASGEDPSRPPLVSAGDKDKVNATIGRHNPDLGWRAKDKNEFEPMGSCIGLVKWDKDENDWLILFYPTPAFDEAAKRFPRLIPHGQSPVSSWTSVWDEKLTAPTKERRRRDGNLELGARVRMHPGEKRQHSGIPVLLSTLLNIDDIGNEDG